MRIWHDDVRRPPDDTWEWARTNKRAKALLLVNRELAEEISLDHDLGCENVDPDAPDAIYLAGPSNEGSGYDLVCWMIEQSLVPPIVTIHSWNPVGAQNMAARLNRFGHNCIIKRYEGSGKDANEDGA